MAFHDVQFPANISQGAQGGPMYQTIVIVTGSGAEQRLGLWSGGRLSWDVSHALRKPATMNQLVAFFRARKGKLHAFRFKDWSDYNAVGASLVAGDAGTWQLAKAYASGEQTETRIITKPVEGTVSLFANGQLMDPSTYDLDYLTGVLTYPLAPLPGPPVIPKGGKACLVVTGTEDPYSTLLCDISGHIDGHGREYEAYQDDSDTPMFIEAGPTPEPYQDLGSTCSSHTNGVTAELSADGTRLQFDMSGCDSTQLAMIQESTGGAYNLRYTVNVGGHYVRYSVEPFDIAPAPDGLLREPECGATLTVDFEFDVPARFDTDQMKFTLNHVASESWEQIPIVEVLGA